MPHADFVHLRVHSAYSLAEGAIQKLYQRLLDNDLSEGDGTPETISLDQNYVERVVNDVALAQPLKVVVDCGNGVAGAIAPQLIEALKGQGAGEIIVVCGGVIPPKDYDELKAAGVSAVYGPGTNIPDAAGEVLDIVRNRSAA